MLWQLKVAAISSWTTSREGENGRDGVAENSPVRLQWQAVWWLAAVYVQDVEQRVPGPLESQGDRKFAWHPATATRSLVVEAVKAGEAAHQLQALTLVERLCLSRTGPGPRAKKTLHFVSLPDSPKGSWPAGCSRPRVPRSPEPWRGRERRHTDQEITDMPCLGEHCLDPFDGLLQQSLAKPPASTQAQASAEDLSCEMHFKRHGSVNRIQGLNFLAEPLIQQCSILNKKTPLTLDSGGPVGGQSTYYRQIPDISATEHPALARPCPRAPSTTPSVRM